MDYTQNLLDGATAPVPATDKGTSTDDTGKLTASPDFWGSVIGGVTGLIGQFNYKGQANQVAIANANRDASLAQAPATSPLASSNTIMYVVIGAIALILVFVLLKPKTAAA